MDTSHNQQKNINSRERNINFLYVFFIVFITVISCSILLFRYNTNFSIFSQKDFVISKMERIRQYQQLQQKEFITVSRRSTLELQHSMKRVISNI